MSVCSFWSILEDMNSARCKCFKCCVLFGRSDMFYFWTAFESFSFAPRLASNPRLLLLEFLELFSSMKNTILSSRDASQIDGNSTRTLLIAYRLKRNTLSQTIPQIIWSHSKNWFIKRHSQNELFSCNQLILFFQYQHDCAISSEIILQ